MSTVQEIQEAILQLPPQDRESLRHWLDIDGNEIVLELAEPPPTKPRFVRSKTSGLVSVAAVPGAAPLTTERVRAVLADFP